MHQRRPYLFRLLIVSAISLVFALAFNEITFFLQKGPADRSPQTIQLVIPAGTAEMVKAGQDEPTIPNEMTFVVGDVLEVKNEDVVSHQLGPVWVPPGATGKLVMNKEDHEAYDCSFTTHKYLGLDVTAATTFGTRLAALLLTAPTIAVLLFLYSLAIWPIQRPEAKTGVASAVESTPGGVSTQL
jgi:hypothetical protein